MKVIINIAIVASPAIAVMIQVHFHPRIASLILKFLYKAAYAAQWNWKDTINQLLIDILQLTINQLLIYILQLIINHIFICTLQLNFAQHC